MPCDSMDAAPATGIADKTFIDRIAAGLVRCAQKRIGRAADPQALRGRGLHHRLRLREAGCQRFFQIDMLAGFDDLQAHRRMRRGTVRFTTISISGSASSVSTDTACTPVLERLRLGRFGADIGNRLHPHQP